MSDNVGIKNIEKNNTKENTADNSPIFSLKQSSFNPMKGSPNYFMSKLLFRLQNYSKEKQLDSDPLSI